MKPGRATHYIILLNCLIVALSLLLPLFNQPDFIHELLPLRISFLLSGAWWQFFTDMWVHAPFYGWGVFHIVFNMLTLSMFGKFVEREIGIPRYLLLYFGTGLLANLFFMAEALIRAQVFGQPQMLDVDVMGASGAVCGVLGTFAMLSPRTKLYVMLIPVPIKALTAVWGLIVVSVILMFTSAAEIIAHSAHIGGALGGLLFGWYLCRRYQPASNQAFLSTADWEATLTVSQMDETQLWAAAPAIYRKICSSGQLSLTPLERKILERLHSAPVGG